MATKSPNEGQGQGKPDVGDTLIVIHDFHARSSDELSLGKGDRVELIERDDEFGDGWFLGRHLVNGNTGLFPEVYTRPTPKNVGMAASSPGLQRPLPQAPTTTQSPASNSAFVSQSQPPEQPHPPYHSQDVDDTSSASHSIPTISENSASHSAPGFAGDASPALPLDGPRNAPHDSRVLSETLNVIDEHITNLRSPMSNQGLLRQQNHDSGSEYSMPLDQRMSYIRGEETDEEEDISHTRLEVEAWTPDAVAEYLFEAGVEKQHCDVFRDQEISGEVLLGMDQSSLFIKAFDLGSVGRRLKTWHKIKALQEEVGGNEMSARRTTATYESEVGSDGARRRSRTNTATTAGSNRPPSVQTRHYSTVQTPKASPTTYMTPSSPHMSEVPLRPGHVKRPSAASVRELHHSRRHSSTDFRGAPSLTPPGLQTDSNSPIRETAHKKQPSFDRNWTLGGAFGQTAQRPQSSAGLQDLLPPPKELQDSAVDLDRGYFSGTEAEGRRRNLLKKRESTAHSRQSSYAEEQRVRSATALSRHSRFGSVDSYRDGPPTASQKYYGVPSASHRRTASTNTTESIRPLPPLKDNVPPTVTKLDAGARGNPPPKQGFNADWLTNMVGKPGSKSNRPGMRAISEKFSAERTKTFGSAEPSPKDSSANSPAPTGSSNNSAGPSFELDSPETPQGAGGMVPLKAAAKKKGKKGTSAYTRGLQSISPMQAKEGADYCGWMKKKSSHLMTTWKPRFFVLNGRRLAYYYSENDEEEKGLIDISFHRVLPADNDKLTGLHATITNAVSGPSIPNSSLSPDANGNSNEPAFIFKLVPPRAGLSRAVTFTKPMVHYFAVPNVEQGRLWMAALMKATIDRDDTQPITTTYQQKTISLHKAKQMRHRPPALMNLDEEAEADEDAAAAAAKHQPPSLASAETGSTPPVGGPSSAATSAAPSQNGLGIFGETDSGVSGMDKLGAKVESGKLNIDFGGEKTDMPPQSA